MVRGGSPAAWFINSCACVLALFIVGTGLLVHPKIPAPADHRCAGYEARTGLIRGTFPGGWFLDRAQGHSSLRELSAESGVPIKSIAYQTKICKPYKSRYLLSYLRRKDWDAPLPHHSVWLIQQTRGNKMLDAFILAATMHASTPKCTFKHHWKASISSEQGVAAGSSWYDVRLTNTGRSCVTRAAAPEFGVVGRLFAFRNNAGARELVVKHGATVHSLLSVTNPYVFSYPHEKIYTAHDFWVSAPVFSQFNGLGRAYFVKSRKGIKVALNVPKRFGNAMVISPLSPGRT